jgi:hypothetical protein
LAQLALTTRMAEGLATCHPTLAMVTCADLADHWDQVIARFLAGEPAVPSDPQMQAWATAYRGRGRGEVSLDAFPATLRWSPPDRFIARRWAFFVGPLRANKRRTDD